MVRKTRHFQSNTFSPKGLVVLTAYLSKTIACTKCNQKKSHKDIKDFLKGKPDRLKKIQAFATAPLRDTVAVNATRYAIGGALKVFGLPISFSSGGRTKFNRTKQGYPKDHWVDAACVGESGSLVRIPKTITPSRINAGRAWLKTFVPHEQIGLFPRTGHKNALLRKRFSNRRHC